MFFNFPKKGTFSIKLLSAKICMKLYFMDRKIKIPNSVVKEKRERGKRGRRRKGRRKERER